MTDWFPLAKDIVSAALPESDWQERAKQGISEVIREHLNNPRRTSPWTLQPLRCFGGWRLVEARWEKLPEGWDMDYREVGPPVTYSTSGVIGAVLAHLEKASPNGIPFPTLRQSFPEHALLAEAENTLRENGWIEKGGVWIKGA